jgi:hypothetical protein
MEAQLLHMPTEDGSLHPVWQQELLSRIPRHMCKESQIVPQDEEPAPGRHRFKCVEGVL